MRSCKCSSRRGSTTSECKALMIMRWNPYRVSRSTRARRRKNTHSTIQSATRSRRPMPSQRCACLSHSARDCAGRCNEVSRPASHKRLSARGCRFAICLSEATVVVRRKLITHLPGLVRYVTMILLHYQTVQTHSSKTICFDNLSRLA